MEMEYTDTKRRGRVVIIVGVVLAVVAGVTSFYLINQAQQSAGQGELTKTPVVVAIRAIPARTAIAEADVTVREVPLDATNLNGVFTTVKDVIGRIPAVTILQDQLITSNMLASTVQGGVFSILGPEETVSPNSEAWRAISITVSDDLAVGGLLRPGETVDVFVTAVVAPPAAPAASAEYITDRSTKIIYQQLTILAREGEFYVIRAPLAVAEEILHLQAAATTTWSLAMRPDADGRPMDATKLGTTTNRIILKYGLPFPESLGPGAATPRPPAATPAPSPTAQP
jgi:Flp pilus assembly protein CpaB